MWSPQTAICLINYWKDGKAKRELIADCLSRRCGTGVINGFRHATEHLSTSISRWHATICRGHRVRPNRTRGHHKKMSRETGMEIRSERAKLVGPAVVSSSFSDDKFMQIMRCYTTLKAHKNDNLSKATLLSSCFFTVHLGASRVWPGRGHRTTKHK